MEETFQGWELFVTRLAIGLVQGLALYALYSALDDKVWPASQGLLFAPLLLGCLFIPTVLISALGEMPLRIALLWSALALMVTAGFAAFDNWSSWPQDWAYSNGWRPHVVPSAKLFFFWGVGLFIAHALVLGGYADRRFMARYPTHFDTAWKLAVQLALAGLFVGVFWLLLWLGAGLFNLIKLDFFQRLIRHSWFAIPVTALAAAGALHLTDIRPAMVRGARTLLLTLLSWLLPLISLIVAGFVMSLPFTGLKTLWSIGHASALLLVAAAALIVLINAAHQDGEPEHLPPRILRLSGKIAAILPAPLSLIAAYALLLRVNQHGWSVERVMLAASIIAALGHAGGYAWAAVRPGTWLSPIKTWNFGMALLILAEIVALFTPIASPERIAVSNQMARLSDRRIALKEFDFHFLRWQGGRYGMEALQQLAAGKDADVAKKARDILSQQNAYSGLVPIPPVPAARFAVYPQGAKLPESFVHMDWNGRLWARPRCPASGTCDAILADLDGDGRPEILIAAGPAFMLQVFHQEADGAWKQAGNIFLPPRCDSVMEALRQGHFQAVPPASHWNDIELNGMRLHLRETDTPLEQPKCPT
ncbi:MAG TPA: hypothetical protein VGH23_19050 [Rhizomicrobium sp.]|jgi:hypothetical protein